MHLPIGALALLVLVDVVVVELVSVAVGVVVARVAGRTVQRGVLLGLCLPLLGPLVWAVVVTVRTPSLVEVRCTRPSPTPWRTAGLLVVPALGFLVSTPLSWGQVSGGYDGHVLGVHATPAATVVGLIATVGTALLLLVGATAAVVGVARRRTSLVLALVVGGWLAATVDSIIVVTTLDGLTTDARDAIGRRVVAEADIGPGLVTCLVAGLIAAAGVVALMRSGSEPNPAVPSLSKAGWATDPWGPAPTPVAGLGSGSGDYGDGF